MTRELLGRETTGVGGLASPGSQMRHSSMALAIGALASANEEDVRYAFFDALRAYAREPSPANGEKVEAALLALELQHERASTADPDPSAEAGVAEQRPPPSNLVQREQR